MFDDLFNHPFSSRSTFTRRSRHRHDPWDLFDSDSTPFSSYENIRHTQHIIAPPSPFSTRAYTRGSHSTVPATDLPSRVNALNRRGASLSTYLSHLAAVVEPLKNAEAEEMSELDLRDILQEGQGLREAMQDFEEQYLQVFGILRDLAVKRGGTMEEFMGEDEKGWGKGGRKRLY